MRISTRLKIISSITFAVIVIQSLALGLAYRQHANERSNSLLAEAIRLKLFERASFRDQYFLYRESRARVQWDKSHADIKRLLGQAEDRFAGDDHRYWLKRLHQFTADNEIIFRRIVDNSEVLKTANGNRPVLEELDRRLSSQLLVRAAASREAAIALHESSEHRVDEAYRQLIAVSTLFVLMLALATILTSLYLGTLIRRRLTPLHEGAGIVADGDLSYRIPTAGDDELAELALSINAMTDKIQASTRQLEEEITERKRVEAALRESEQQLRRVIEGSDQGFWDWNLQTDVFTVSPRFETMLGYEPGEMNLSVDNWHRHVEASDLAKAAASIEQHLAGKSPAHELEFRMRAKSGEWRWVLTRGRIVERTDDGRPRMMSGTHTDISERKRSEAALKDAMAEAEKANCAKSHFLAAASHDLRQPLSALSIYAELLGHSRSPSEQKVVASMRDCIGGLSGLLTDLLDLSKLQAGVVTPSVCDFPIAEMLAGLDAENAPEAELKGLRLRWIFSRLMACSDPVLYRRILGNLVANAIRYTESGGVLVACRRRQGKTWVEVWDTGIGIPADQTTEIFEEFKQLGDGARNNGSGLGLAIVARTAALLGLELSVRSRLGRGSVFAIELPLGQLAPVMPPPAPQALKSRAQRFALVDDNPMVRTAMATAVQSLGHQVVAAPCAATLLAELGPLRPDIVVSDYRLAQGETGFDVITAVQTRFGNALPAILITGDTDPNLMRNMTERGIIVLHKPVKLETLMKCVEELTGYEI